MIAIARRELNSYFTAPIGYIFLGVFYLFAGFFFTSGSLYAATTDMSSLFSSLFTVFVFIIPILTMKLLSEEKKQKTEQALLTAPISLFDLVMGKFIAAFSVYLMGISITLIYVVVISAFASPDWASFFGYFIGIIILGAALIAIGMFVSAVTESQIIAAILTFVILMFFTLVDAIASIVDVGIFSYVLDGLSIYERYYDFTLGIFNFSNVIFFISLTGVFIFFTARVFERRRWK